MRKVTVNEMRFLKGSLKVIGISIVWLSVGTAWGLFIFNYFSKNSLMNNLTSAFILMVLLVVTFDLLKKKKVRKSLV
ncbi:hypothetical protein [Bacillus cereus]|uniref:hypothetical protein n=1 Tax=Bacillus cereus TaxID=1396 RepID=UPI000B4BAA0E|nr:hypothetical protein [Bacillus cereus]